MRLAHFAGILGMILIHSSAIPGIVAAMNGENVPILMIAQNSAALSLLTFHALRFRVWLYLAGNLAGLMGQLILLVILLTR